MAYSIDLHQRVLDAYLGGEGSQRTLAKRFKVSRGFIQNLLRLYQETGSVHPRAHGGGAPAKIDVKTLPVVAELIKTQADATLEELCADLKAKTNTEVSVPTMHRATIKLGLTYTKNFVRQ